MSEKELKDLFDRIPRRPRYVNDAPRTIKELTQIVVAECHGDASQIWKGKKAEQVHQTFNSIYGVGPGIASMAVLLIEKAFPIRFDDREHMDIKPDVHTVRVLYRLGVSSSMTVEFALKASQRMNPEFPGKVDGALWEIGRRWCRPTNPDCTGCPVTAECVKRIQIVPSDLSNLSDQPDNFSNQEINGRKIVLTSCVSQKLPYRAKAKDLYVSPLFRKNLAYANQINPDEIYVLSAKYGLVNLDTKIDPYDLTLNTMSEAEIKGWAKMVLEQLGRVGDVRKDHFILLAGLNYRKYLIPYLGSYEVPMEGLTIGKQLGFLSKHSNSREMNDEKDQKYVPTRKSLGTTGKYSRLSEYLSTLSTSQHDITLSFSEIENALNVDLPNSARRYRAWWSNEAKGSHIQARSWLDLGWIVETVDFARMQVKFRRKKIV